MECLECRAFTKGAESKRRLPYSRGGMTSRWRFAAIGALAAMMMLGLGTRPGMAQSRPHVYLLRGLMNIFSLGMDTLAAELNRHGVYATVHNHSEWQTLANEAAANYKAGKEGPIIIIGHSLGADAVMYMAAALGNKGVPVALAVPFDGTQTLTAPSNVAHVLNLTQRSYAYVRRGAGFHGTLANVDVSSDPSIDHLNIDKSPRLHARVISEVLAIVGSGGGHKYDAPNGAKPTTVNHVVPSAAPAEERSAKPEGTSAPAKSNSGAMNAIEAKPLAERVGAPVIAAPERRGPTPTVGADAPSHKAAKPAAAMAGAPD